MLFNSSELGAFSQTLITLLAFSFHARVHALMLSLVGAVRGGAHAVPKAISLLHRLPAGLTSFWTSGGLLTSQQESPNAAAAAATSRPPLITCAEGNALGSHF